MRVTGGIARGIPLRVPAAGGVRPATDYIREAVFNSLAAFVPGTAVLDLFAGTGALGFEALSRGARFCLFIEETSEARGLIRRNADALGLIGQCRIWRRDATRLGPCAPQTPFDLAFADPPYGKGLGEAALGSLVQGGWLRPGAVIVLEEAERTPLPEISGLAAIDRRTYGDTQIGFYRAT